MNNLNLTIDQVNSLLYGDPVYKDEHDENCIFEVIETHEHNYDSEHGAVDVDVIIQEIETNKYYKATLTKSHWGEQARANAEVNWTEVKPRTIKTIIYVPLVDYSKMKKGDWITNMEDFPNNTPHKIKEISESKIEVEHPNSSAWFFKDDNHDLRIIPPEKYQFFGIKD